MSDLDAALANLQEHIGDFDATSHAELTALIASLSWTCTVAEQRLCLMEAAFGPRKQDAAHVE
jgi:hypothetical protein